ncbi:MAG: HEAT repeat domain-containing protein [Methanobacteriota archaeon]|nr:MAG: HEAT repeat domain-containing protein [Euryarchaeota archaeon]
MVSKLPREEIQELFNDIKSGNSSAKIRACQRLGRIRRDECVEPLIYALNDDYYLTRMVAIQSLSWIGDPRMIEPIINVFTSDPDPRVRFQAAEVLAPLIHDHPEIRNAFEKALQNGIESKEMHDLIKTVLS